MYALVVPMQNPATNFMKFVPHITYSYYLKLSDIEVTGDELKEIELMNQRRLGRVSASPLLGL